jgi:hypothetical protein
MFSVRYEIYFKNIIRLNVSRIGTIEYGFESHGTQTRVGLRCQGPAATVNYTPVLSPERALQSNKPSTGKKNSMA